MDSELSPGQQYAFELFKQGKNVFTSGPGGSGKSHLVKYIVEHLTKQNKIHQVTSTTGCSSILLSNNIRIGGKPIVVKTIHSWSGIKLGKGSKDEIVRQVMKRDRVVKEWRRTQVLVVDEVSMLSNKLFDTLETIARTTRKSNKPFGGMQVIFLGDFYQLPPVGDYNDPSTSQFCFEAPQWYKVFPKENHVELTTIYRQRDPLYKKVLNEVRVGNLSEESKEIIQNRVGKVYNPAEHNGIIPMKIFATKNQVKFVNESQYEKLEGREYVYDVIQSTRTRRYIETGDPIEPDVLEQCENLSFQEMEYEINTLKNNIPTDAQIKLKPRTPVMCLVNLDVESGIANGSMGIIEDFLPQDGESIPIVRFTNGLVMPIGRYVWQHSEYPTICVSQIPLCLSYSNSIHKMQGSTLDICEMNLGGTIFAEHQIYVALSRVCSLEGLYLTAFHPHRIKVNPVVRMFYQNFPQITDDMASSVVVEDTTEGDLEPIEGDVCPICISDYLNPYITDCKHKYCYDCIVRLINCSEHRQGCCPLCRSPITSKTIYPMEPQQSKRKPISIKTPSKSKHVFSFIKGSGGV
jgi:ATP-dependent DNA helicase PIF1